MEDPCPRPSGKDPVLPTARKPGAGPGTGPGTLQGGRIHRLVEHARGVTDHPVLAAVARLGLVAYGVLHLLIGWLAVQLARGSTRTDAGPPPRTAGSR